VFPPLALPAKQLTLQAFPLDPLELLDAELPELPELLFAEPLELLPDELPEDEEVDDLVPDELALELLVVFLVEVWPLAPPDELPLVPVLPPPPEQAANAVTVATIAKPLVPRAVMVLPGTRSRVSRRARERRALLHGTPGDPLTLGLRDHGQAAG
jgi:hypothetical protein